MRPTALSRERPCGEDRGHPQSDEHALVAATGEPQADREQERGDRSHQERITRRRRLSRSRVRDAPMWCSALASAMPVSCRAVGSTGTAAVAAGGSVRRARCLPLVSRRDERCGAEVRNRVDGPLHGKPRDAALPRRDIRLPQRLPTTEQWDPGVVEAERLGDAPIGAGTEFRSWPGSSAARTPSPTASRVRARRRGHPWGETQASSPSTGSPSSPPAGARASPTTPRLRLNGLLRLADPLLGLAFNRVGRRALDGLRGARRSGDRCVTAATTMAAGLATASAERPASRPPLRGPPLQSSILGAGRPAPARRALPSPPSQPALGTSSRARCP